jgi:hypothetical protein
MKQVVDDRDDGFIERSNVKITDYIGVLSNGMKYAVCKQVYFSESDGEDVTEFFLRSPGDMIRGTYLTKIVSSDCSCSFDAILKSVHYQSFVFETPTELFQWLLS